MSRARVVDGGGARSSPPTIRRCATAASIRAPLHRLQAARRSGERGADPDRDLALSWYEHDGQQAGALVDQQPEQRRPKRVIGDTAYGNVEARERLETALDLGARPAAQHFA